MKFFYSISTLLLLGTACKTTTQPLKTEVKALVRKRMVEDTSVVYALPFEPGRKRLLVQGYFGSFSHKERAALDFYLRSGTPVTAVRDGVVLQTKKDGTKRGLRYRYKSHNNFVLIRHADGYVSGYYHLQHNGVLVQKGDTVKQGQKISLSGNTGYSAFPHLHLSLIHI